MKNTTKYAVSALALTGLIAALGASAHETDAGIDNSALLGGAASGSIRAKLIENRDQNSNVRNKLIEEHRDLKDELEERYEERTEEWADAAKDIEAKREALKAELRAKLEDDITTRVQAVVLKLYAHRDRLDTLADRIESRIVKFEEKSIDTKAVRDSLDASRAKIAEADNAIYVVKRFSRDKEAEIAATSTMAIRTGELKALIKDAETLLKAANQSLVDTVTKLKPGQLKLDAIIGAAATTTDR